jgi:mycothiol synthase
MLLLEAPIAPLELRTPDTDELAELQAIWSVSQDHDEPAGRPPGCWWSIQAWMTASRVLIRDGVMIGFAAIEYRPSAEAAEARLGLLPAHRRPLFAEQLIHAAIDLAYEAGASRIRLYAPASALWVIIPTQRAGFRARRTQHLMLRPATAPPLVAPPVAGVRIRCLRHGEEAALLAALNRAWAATWNFRPITAAALAQDLRDQRDGMLVAVDEADDSIIGTAQAVFNPAANNPDGAPYAWISNLTTDPAWRGKGLGRTLLAAGLAHLRERGGHSAALAVDGGSPAPLNLYRSAGFETLSMVTIWERSYIGNASARLDQPHWSP